MTALTAARELTAFLHRNGGRTAGSAAVVLEGLRAVVPSDCLALSVWDPVRGRHRTLASTYPAHLTDFLDDGMHADPLFSTVQRGGTPIRVRDLPASRRRGRIFDVVIAPSGFRDGITHCLFSGDGRYVGMVNASSLDTRHPDDDAVALLALLGADLAAALDPVPRLRPPTARLDDGGSEGLLLHPDGRVVPLTGGARPDLLAGPAPLRAAVRGVRGGWHRMVLVHGSSVYDVEVHATDDGVVAVLHREVDPPAGLSVRELQVLARMADGLGNIEIAAVLGIGARTVATHVEHTLAKTGCRNRAAAAATAARWGLLVRSPGRIGPSGPAEWPTSLRSQRAELQ